MVAEIQGKLNALKHLIAAIGWVGLFVASIYVLVERMVTSKPYIFFHLVIPFALLLVSIRSTRGYLAIRKR